MNELHKSKTFIWTLAGIFVLIWLYALGIRTLVPPDEGRYAEMAREMFVTGDWITTRLNGIKYFEKPPLQTWMNALTFAAFGIGEWQARLWTGLCGLLGVFMTGYAGFKVFNQRVGFYAALVLGSSFYWVGSGQVDSLDMGLTGMMTIALCALLIAQRDGATEQERRNWMLVCWTGMALAMLAKGLIGIVLPGAALTIYILITRDWKLVTRLHMGKGLLLFCAVAAPWFVLVAMRNPEQPYFFFIHEHFERFLLKGHAREGGWYYFFVILAVGIVPWLGLLAQSLWQATKKEATQFRPRLLLLIWTVFIFAFFSKSTSKLPGYILPIFPSIALLIGLYLEDGTRRSRILAAAVMSVVGIGLLAAVPYMPKMARHAGEDVLMMAMQPWVLAGGFVALAGGGFALLHARHMRRDLMAISLAIAGFLSTELILTGFEPYGNMRAGVQMLPAIQAELKPNSTIYAVGTYEQSMTFYMQRTVTLVDYWDEFTFGLKQQPQLSIPTVDAWVAVWRDHAGKGIHDLAFIRNDIFDQLSAQGVPMRVVARDARRIVIANK